MGDKFKICNKYLKEFNQFDVPDIFQQTRERGIIEYRQLFQTILKLKARLTHQTIADFTEEKGLSCKHSTIVNSVKRTTETNYYESVDLANIYDHFLNDKIIERARATKRKKQNTIDYQKRTYKKGSKLWTLMKEIPKSKEEEVYELLRLRVKSWEWKSKDSCKVYTGQTQLER